MPDLPDALRRGSRSRRLRLPARSLSRRLAGLAVAVALSMQALVFLPSLARARLAWFEQRIHDAQIAALSAVVSGNAIDRATRLGEPGRGMVPPGKALPDPVAINPREESFVAGMAHAVGDLFRDGDQPMTIEARGPLVGTATVTVVLRQRELHRVLVDHARRMGLISLLVAAMAGASLYAAMLALLVRPIRRLTDCIATVRADPERSVPLDPAMLPSRPGDEIAAAGRELAAMQHELRAALWRDARLAALGTAMAKISHDMRGTLSPALLTAERLQMSQEPSIRRAGDVLVRAVERATELMRRTVEFVRETPLTLTKGPIALRPATEDAAEQARAACPGLAVENAVPDDFAADGDRESMVRALGNLLRNAGEAGARRVRVTAEVEANELAVTVADDGPGLPEAMRAALFRPFVNGGRRGGAGLGLAIVRDLMRAQGGDVTLLETGEAGTRFRLTLPARRPAPIATPAASATARG